MSRATRARRAATHRPILDDVETTIKGHMLDPENEYNVLYWLEPADGSECDFCGECYAQDLADLAFPDMF